MAKPKQVARSGLPPEHLAGLRALTDLAGQLACLADPESLQETTLVHALRMFRCASGAVCLCDGQGHRVRLGRAVGKAESLAPDKLLDVAPVREVVLERGQPLVLADPGMTLGPAMACWNGLAVVPIACADRLLGLVVLGDLADGDAFGETDTALMAAMGKVVAVAVETSLVHSEFRQEMGLRMTEAMAELSRAAAELRRLKTFQAELFESLPVGFIRFDTDFRVTFRNAAAERLWPDDRSVVEAARRTDVARHDPEWEHALAEVVNMQRPWLAEGVVLDRPGREPLRLNLSCSPVLSDKREVVGGVMIVEDVTQRVQMERRLAVSERLAGVGRLAAMVAHEINNPLDGIIRLLNLARRVSDDAGDERVRKYLEDANKGLMRMVTVVRELLDFSRSASGSVDPMPIQEIVAEAAHAMGPVAEKAGVAIEMTCHADLPALKSGSLYHVVLNLLKNAIEATPAGGKVRVAARCRGNALLIEVADTGPGIPPEALPRLFEPFFSLKAMGKGTGLGLVISRDLVEKQGGAITAGNRPEGGAVFTVSIPLAPGTGGQQE